ncbi:hypothetical protein CGH11_22650 [Vibrio parahaemolyticus]|nr:hypothetical protein CGH11_22650 [Vibrio parahaemolyticus]
MRVLYVNVYSLLYSPRYINSNESVLDAYLSGRCRTPLDVMRSIPHDVLSARLLEQAALSAGMLIYPIEPRGVRRFILDKNVFRFSSLAPDIDWTGKLRMGNDNHIARIRKHVELTGVKSWRSCGDLFYWELKHQQHLHLKSPSDKGVTPELLRRIRAIYQEE